MPGQRWFLVLWSLLLHGGRWDQILESKPTYWRGRNSILKFYLFIYLLVYFILSSRCFWNIPEAKFDSWYKYFRPLCNVCSISLLCLKLSKIVLPIIQIVLPVWSEPWSCWFKIQALLDVVIWTYLVFDCFSWKVSGRWQFWTKVIVKIKSAVLFRCWCR